MGRRVGTLPGRGAGEPPPRVSCRFKNSTANVTGARIRWSRMQWRQIEGNGPYTIRELVQYVLPG